MPPRIHLTFFPSNFQIARLVASRVLYMFLIFDMFTKYNSIVIELFDPLNLLTSSTILCNERLMSENVQNRIRYEELIDSINRYIDVLMESYPKALTQKELADIARVSPSAVSKIKEKIFPLCNIEKLAFDSKLILEPNLKLFNTILRIKGEEYNIPGILRILSTKYGEKMLEYIDIHNYLINEIPLYGKFFNRYESKFLITLFLRLIRTLRISVSDEEYFLNVFEKFKEINTDEIDEETFMSYISSYIWTYIVSNKFKNEFIEFPVESEQEIHMTLVLRDKIYQIFQNIIRKVIINISFSEILTEEEESSFKKITKKIINHYLKQIFTTLTKYFESDMIKKGLPFDEKYKKIGVLINEITMLEKLNEISNGDEENR